MTNSSAIPQEIRNALAHVLDLALDVELEDFENNPQKRDGHIFHSLHALSCWLRATAREATMTESSVMPKKIRNALARVLDHSMGFQFEDFKNNPEERDGHIFYSLYVLACWLRDTAVE